MRGVEKDVEDVDNSQTIHRRPQSRPQDDGPQLVEALELDDSSTNPQATTTTGDIELGVVRSSRDGGNVEIEHAYNAELLAAMKRECFPNWEEVQREVIEAERE